MTGQAGGEQDAGARTRRPNWLLIGVVLVALVIAAVVSFRLGSADSSSALPAPTPNSTSTSTDQTSTGPLSTSDIYTVLAPSVVAVLALRDEDSTTTAPGTGSSVSPAPTTAGTVPDAPPVVTASTGEAGTGVIVNSDGSVLTALHVVENADSIQVTFADGTTTAATIAASDPATDMAILRVQTLPTVVVPAVLGSSNGLAVGDSVVAIGNQLGLTYTTTTGVVSGLGRSASRAGAADLEGLIQFDAAVNEGSSGGPLVNAKGETVGIVVALANPTDAHTFIGIGFAVPIGAALAAGGQVPPK